jgi:hypothetical protein
MIFDEENDIRTEAFENKFSNILIALTLIKMNKRRKVTSVGRAVYSNNYRKIIKYRDFSNQARKRKIQPLKSRLYKRDIATLWNTSECRRSIKCSSSPRKSGSTKPLGVKLSEKISN